MQFRSRLYLALFITNAEKMICELEDAYILLHEKKLSGYRLLPLLESVVQSANRC